MRDWHPSRHLPLLLALGAVVVAVDQVSKSLMVQFFSGLAYPSVALLGDWLRFSLATNTGAAFGLLPQQTGLFVLATAIVVPVIIYFSGTSAADPWLVRLSLGLMLGGGLGNFIDRVRLGYVVDFVDVGVGTWRWPAFNVADAAFVVGTISVIAYVLFWPQPALRPEVDDGSPSA